MCGIAGMVAASVGQGASQSVARMMDALAPRGPDGEGLWSDPVSAVALGHRRLAIVGTGAEGSQPMESRDGRYVLTFNGMIYNYQTLAQEIGAPNLASDTGVLVEAIAHWGLQDCLPRLIGMFAFALWDRKEQSLHLVRDRYGQKPLMYATASGGLAFASTLDGLLPALSNPKINRQALSSFLALGCVPEARSIVDGVEKVQPGQAVTFHSGSITRATWFDQKTSFERPSPMPSIDSVVADHLIADVPVGLFLSGGIDSSTVAALASQQQPGLPAFTLGLSSPDLDESGPAAAIARALGLDHRVIPADTEKLAEALPRVVTALDEPFADEAALGTLLLSEAAHNQVKVVLTGDGGDEVFGGYTRHRHLPALKKFPRWTAPAVAAASRMASGHRARHLDKAAKALAAPSMAAAYQAQFGYWPQPFDQELWADQEDVRALDIAHYLPSDGFVKVDRTTMASGLEARPPLADQRLLMAALGNRETKDHPKQSLIHLATEKLDPALLNRPKAGFTLPTGDLLRGPLYTRLSGAVDGQDWSACGIQVDQALDRLAADDERAARPLYALLMLHLWSEKTGISLDPLDA